MVYRLTQTDWVESEVCWNYRYGTTEWTNAGGTYTETNGASATVPASYGDMSWTVTAQVLTAVTDGINAHFLLKDQAENFFSIELLANFRSKEATSGTKPKLSVTYTAPWDSYESDYSTSKETYDTYGELIYMKGTGFPDGTYTIKYYDADATEIGSESKSASSGVLTSSMACNTEPSAADGTWHAKAYSGSDLIADDTFTVDQAAIPEFPAVIASISVAGLCFGIYYWMRRRKLGVAVRIQ